MSDLNLFLATQNRDFKIVVVTFPGSPKPYHYKTLEANINACDLVVVEAPGGFKIVEVLEVLNPLETEFSSRYQLKWLVCKVDTTNYDKCVEMEKEATKALNQLKYAKRSEEVVEQLNERLGKAGVDIVTKLVRL